MRPITHALVAAMVVAGLRASVAGAPPASHAATTMAAAHPRAGEPSSAGGYTAESASEWRDPSPHRSGFVTVRGVRLHYLDWGGRGPAVILLPGLGSTAHAFDDIAPKLADRFHVLALTPRAHGESGIADTLSSVEMAADDVKALMDTLSIARAHLVGQSISGATLTRFATRHPERVGKLVYLDATLDYGGADEAEEEKHAVPRPRPEKGFASTAEYRAWAERYFFGTWTAALEADMWAGTAPGNDAESHAKARSALVADATDHPKDYRPLRAPALALWAEKTLDTHYFWLDRTDSAAVARAQDHLQNFRRPWEQKGVDRFRREARNGRVVAVPGHHWMFITDERRVLQEIRRFLLAR